MNVEFVLTLLEQSVLSFFFFVDFERELLSSSEEYSDFITLFEPTRSTISIFKP
jgi:hypothetical protein